MQIQTLDTICEHSLHYEAREGSGRSSTCGVKVHAKVKLQLLNEHPDPRAAKPIRAPGFMEDILQTRLENFQSSGMVGKAKGDLQRVFRCFFSTEAGIQQMAFGH